MWLRRHCSLPLGEETSDAQTLGKGALSLTEFLSRNECNESRKSRGTDIPIRSRLVLSTSLERMGMSAPR